MTTALERVAKLANSLQGYFENDDIEFEYGRERQRLYLRDECNTIYLYEDLGTTVMLVNNLQNDCDSVRWSTKTDDVQAITFYRMAKVLMEHLDERSMDASSVASFINRNSRTLKAFKDEGSVEIMMRARPLSVGSVTMPAIYGDPYRLWIDERFIDGDDMDSLVRDNFKLIEDAARAL